MDLHMADQDGGAADPFNPAGGSVGTKRGLADSQACLDEQRPSQEQQHEEAEAAEEEEPPPALTSLVAQGLADTEARRQQLHGMIDELAQVGLSFLDAQRERFIGILESFKDELDKFCQEEVAKGQQVSFDTLAAHDRLQRAQLLVQSLGGAVCQPRGGGGGPSV